MRDFLNVCNRRRLHESDSANKRIELFDLDANPFCFLLDGHQEDFVFVSKHRFGLPGESGWQGSCDFFEPIGFIFGDQRSEDFAGLQAFIDRVGVGLGRIELGLHLLPFLLVDIGNDIPLHGGILKRQHRDRGDPLDDRVEGSDAVEARGAGFGIGLGFELFFLLFGEFLLLFEFLDGRIDLGLGLHGHEGIFGRIAFGEHED